MRGDVHLTGYILELVDNDQWLDRIRDVLRDLAGEVAEARAYIATYLGAARTALALASAAENAENLDAAERDYMELWQQHEANMRALRADSEAPARAAETHDYFTPGEHAPAEPEIEAVLAEKAALKKTNLERRAKDRESVDRAKQGKVEKGKKTRATVGELFKKSREAHTRWSDDQVCESVGGEMKMHKTTVREHARALGLLSTDVLEKVSAKTGRNSNTVT